MADIQNAEYNNKGKVTCDKRILLSIISLATKEISGVSELVDKPSLFFKRIFTKYDTKGVMIKISPNGKITIDVYIKVFSGVNVADISFRIQENIKNNISSMVELKTGKINVHIVGVNFVKQGENAQNA